MIDYLINSVLCSALCLIVYHLLLQNKAMYAFNRFYLLGSIMFSLTVPLVVIHQDVPIIASVQPIVNQYIDYQPETLSSAVLTESRISDTAESGISILWYIYFLITGVLLLRFAANLYFIRKKVRQNKCEYYEGCKLILSDDKLSPHTFLNCIFLNQEEYRSQKIEVNIMYHEMAHVRQWHSADIIFMEFIQAFYWINPLIVLYKNAIRLNHEFIADSFVLEKENNVAGYQYLIMSKLSETQGLSIASQLNYSLTKKRMIMMTKKTPPATAWMTRLAVLPLMVIAFVLFCNMDSKTENVQPVIQKLIQTGPAQDARSRKHPPLPPFAINPLPSPKVPASQQVIDEYSSLSKKYESPDYYNNKLVMPAVDRIRMEKLYIQMNAEQRNEQSFVFGGQFRKVMPLLNPSAAQFESWKDAAVYGVWIDGKHVKNEDLNNYKSSDFSHYSKSNLHYTEQNKKNIMKQFNLAVMYKYQIDLMTTDYYEKMNAQITAERDKTVMYYIKNTPAGHYGLHVLRQ